MSRGFTRRDLVTRLGLGAAGALAVSTLPVVSETPAGQGEVIGAVTPDSVAIDESATPYGVWHYRPDGGEMVPTAPINVVCPLETATFGDVIDVFEAAGWYSDPAEYARYAWDRGEQQYRVQQWTGAETYFGLAGRAHVRCWELDGTASIQAHVDTPTTPNHRIASYADGRDIVEQLFRQAGWIVAEEHETLGNDKAPDHDGMATVIHRGESA